MDHIWIALTAAAVLGVHGGYQGALADACVKVSKEISSGGRLQDAITPPASVNARAINWISTLSLYGVTWYYLGLNEFFTVLAMRIGSSVLAMVFLKSSPPRPFLLKRIFHSMSNREADFVKSGDTMRAKAMGDLRKRFMESNLMDEII